MSAYQVTDFEGLVGELILGKVVILAWEWCGEDTDPETWAATLAQMCEWQGMDVYFVRVPRRNLTICWNAAANPTQEFVEEGVRLIELGRAMNTMLPSKEEYLKVL